MKKLLLVNLLMLTCLVMISLIGCQKNYEVSPSLGETVKPRIPDCGPGDYWTKSRIKIANCNKKSCESGIGFRCGGITLECNNGIFTIDYNNPCFSIQLEESGFTTLPPLPSQDPRGRSVTFEFINSSHVRIVFNESLPESEIHNTEFVVDDSSLIYYHFVGLTFNGNTYHYVRMLEGEYEIDYNSSNFGSVVIDATYFNI